MSDDPNANPAPVFVETIAEPHREFVKNKGWDSPDKVVDSYRQLEQFVGAEKAGRGVVLPNEKSTPEEIAAFHGKLGVPAAPKDYELAVPADFPDPEFGPQASQLLHKHHIPKAQGQAFMNDVVELVTKGRADQAATEQAEFAKQEAALKAGWGAEFDRNAEIAKRGAKRLGFSDEVIDQLEAKAGFADTLKALHKAGELLGEGKFVGAGDGQGLGGESIDSLLAKRTALTRDPAWAVRFHANDSAAQTEWKALEEKIALARKQAA